MAGVWSDRMGMAGVFARLPENASGALLLARLASWRFARDGASPLGVRRTLAHLLARPKHGPALYLASHGNTLVRAARNPAADPDPQFLHLAERLGAASAAESDHDDVRLWAEAFATRSAATSRMTVDYADDLYLWLAGRDRPTREEG